MQSIFHSCHLSILHALSNAIRTKFSNWYKTHYVFNSKITAKQLAKSYCERLGLQLVLFSTQMSYIICIGKGTSGVEKSTTTKLLINLFAVHYLCWKWQQLRAKTFAVCFIQLFGCYFRIKATSYSQLYRVTMPCFRKPLHLDPLAVDLSQTLAAITILHKWEILASNLAYIRKFRLFFSWLITQQNKQIVKRHFCLRFLSWTTYKKEQISCGAGSQSMGHGTNIEWPFPPNFLNLIKVKRYTQVLV